MRTLTGKKAIVTGAAAGIGREIALELARHGAQLALWDIDEAALAQTAEMVTAAGGTSFVRRCDLAQPSQITAAVQDTLQQWQRVDVLVNNAGVAYYGAADRMTPQQWDWVLCVNLLAPIQLIRELLPTFLAQGEAHVVNIASIGGLVAQTRMAAYHTTKFGLVGLTEALRAEYDHRGIGFTAVCPGLTRTAFLTNVATSRKRPPTIPPRWLAIEPRVVARKAVAAIRKNRGLVLAGPMAHVLWACKRISPWLFDFVNRFHRKKK